MGKRITMKDVRKLGLVEVSPGVFKRAGNCGKRVKISKNRIKVSNKQQKVDLFIISINQELGITVVPEHQFHDERRWRFDYAILDQKIAIEVEGGVWTNGRHTRGKGYLNDMEKYNAAVTLGWRLIRVTPEQLNKRYTINQIKKLINHK